MAWKLLAAAALAVSPGSALRHFQQDVNATRRLFVAGVLGSGLEFWDNVLQECTKAEVCETLETNFYTTWMLQQGDPEQLRKVWRKDRPRSGGGRLVLMNNAQPEGAEMPAFTFSRPFAGRARPFNDNPDLPLYAKVAKEFGDSLKVLVMLRNESDILYVTQKDQKDHKKTLEDLEMMAVENVRALISNLKRMPRESFRCQNYEDLEHFGKHLQYLLSTSPETVHRGGLHDLVEEALLRSDHITPGCNRVSKGKKTSKYCQPAPRLRSALNDLEKLCQPGDLGKGYPAVGDDGKTELDVRDMVETNLEEKAKWLVDW